MSQLITALFCAMAAVCYHTMLIEPGKPFEWLYTWLRKTERRFWGCDMKQRRGRVFSFLTVSLRECVWCLAGQLALIHTLTTSAYYPSIMDFLFVLLFNITASILLSALLLPLVVRSINSMTNG